jgi:two-component system nitrogen regulation sensor histidine kinase NtrY
MELKKNSSYKGQFEFDEPGLDSCLLVNANNLYDEAGNLLGAIFVVDDVKEQVQSQKMLAWKEVARRIAHEIKNPITPIKLNAQRLVRKFQSRFEGEDLRVFVSCMDMIVNQVDSLRDLVNEFSEFSRMPSIRLERTDITKVISESVALYSLSYPSVNFVVEANSPLWVQIDKTQINRVFVNLISNAIAALEEEEFPEIKIIAGVIPDLSVCRIQVIDNGIGIKDDMKTKVLEPYVSSKAGGTGLGLAIVHRIITDHRGYVRIVENNPKGVCVLIELPLNVE